METLKNIIKITLSDYNTLVANGSIVKNGVTYNYSPNDTIYITANGYGDDYVELCGGGGYPLSSLANIATVSNIKGELDNEVDARQKKDYELQQQIDAIVDADDTTVVNTSHVAHTEKAYATSASDTRGHWTVSIPGITSLYDGLKIHVKLSTYWYGNGEAYNTLNVNGLGAKMVWWRYNSRLTTHFDKNAEVTLTYRSDCGSYEPTVTTGELTKGTVYTDGWMADYAYYSQNLEDLRYYYSRPYAGSTISAHHLCAFDETGKLIMLTNESGSGSSFTPTTTAFRPEDIVCCVSNVTAGNQVGEGQIYNQRAACYTNYNFGTQPTVASTIYLAGYAFDDGLFVLNTSNWFKYVPSNTTASLSTYFNTGTYYIRVGVGYGNSSYFTLFAHNDVYYFDGLSLMPCITRAKSAINATNSANDGVGNNIVNHYSTATNIKNSTSTGGLDQLHDSGNTFDFTDKNPNATTYDSTLTGTLTKGASGNYASSFGGKSVASGKRAFAEGTLTIAKGAYSHAEGGDTVTLGEEAHAEGFMSTAVGQASHAEGHSTVAAAIYSHAEGDQTLASGNVSHAEGYLTKATKEYSHAEGMNTTASGATAHAEGDATTANGMDSHAEGYSSTASGDYSHAEGNLTQASGNSSHAEGYKTEALHPYSHAEGMNTTANGDTAHVEGNLSTASGTDSHAEGYSSIASGATSHAEGANTVASGTKAHAEGYKTTAQGDHSHSEGAETKALGTASHAEGLSTQASNVYDHAEGMNTVASGTVSHAEGNATKALGADSHAEGKQTTANAASSHAEGFGSYAGGTYSHAEGYYAKTSNDAEHASGKYNNSRTGTNGTIFSVGIGTSDTARKNAIDIGANGDTYIYGVGNFTGNNVGASSTVATVLNTMNTAINKKIGTSDLVTTINGGTTSTYPPTANAVRAYVESMIEEATTAEVDAIFGDVLSTENTIAAALDEIIG